MQGWHGVAAALLLTLSLLGCHAQATSQKSGVYTLRYGSPYTPNHPFSRADIAWMHHVEELSHGRLKIQPFWGGGLTSSDYSVIELQHGVVDIALITPIYAPSGMQLLKTQTGFYEGARTSLQQVELYKCLAHKFPAFQHELSGIHVLAVQGGSLPNLLTRGRPVRNVQDLAGLRLRAPEELIPVLEHFGAGAVAMPMADVYSAMSKGIIDGVVAPTDTLKTLHFNEVGHFMNMLVVPRGAYPARAISDRAWRNLPPDLQMVLTESETFWEGQLDNKIATDEEAGAVFGKAHGIEFVAFDPSSQSQFSRAYDSIENQKADGLAKYAIPGGQIFTEARRLVNQKRTDNNIVCE